MKKLIFGLMFSICLIFIANTALATPFYTKGTREIYTIFDEFDEVRSNLETAFENVNSNLGAGLALKEDIANKDQPDGYAGLDSSGYLKIAELPDGFGNAYYVRDDQANMNAISLPVEGNMCLVLDDGDGKRAAYVYRGAPTNSWQKISDPDFINLDLDAGNITTGTLDLDRLPSTLTGKDADTVDGIEGAEIFKHDGTVVMTGDLEMNDYSINNVNATSINFTSGKKIVAAKFDSSGNIEAETLGTKNINTIESERAAEILQATQSRIFKLDSVNGTTAALGADGYSIPFSNISELMTAIETDIQTRIAGSETRSDCKYIVDIAPGVYTEDFDIPACAFLQINMPGSELSGNINRTVTQTGFGGDYYSKIVFNGGESHRAEKGHQSILSGDLSISTADASSYLHYTTFKGIELSGDITVNHGVDLMIFDHSSHYTSGKTILGTGAILLEMLNRSRIKATLSGDVACYNCFDSELNSVNVTPTNDSKFYNMEFSGSFTIAAGNIYVDAVSHKSLMSQTPTLTGATLQYFESASNIENDSGVSGTFVKDALNTLDGNFSSYLNLAGSGVMTGDIDAGGNSLTNVNLVDGIDVSASDAKQQSGTSKPTCDASVRGYIYVTEGGSSVADAAEICVKNSSDVYGWISIATIP